MNTYNSNTEYNKAIKNKNSSLDCLDKCMLDHINHEEFKQSNNLAKWFEKFAKYHNEEKIFSSQSLLKYKRGQIILAELGYNIGNEFGGLHFCIVLNKKDSNRNGILTVLPLTSKNRNHEDNIYLDNEIYVQMLNNLIAYEKQLLETKRNIQYTSNNKHISKQLIDTIDSNLKIIDINKQNIEVFNKNSTIITNQILTISKQRIYPRSFLKNVKISNKFIDKIDKKIIELFTK